MFFRRLPCQGIKNMGEVGRPFFYGPVLHNRGHRVGDGGIHALAELYGFTQRLVDPFGQPLAHDLVVEHIAAENVLRFRVHEIQRRGLGPVVCDSLNGVAAGVVLGHA